MDEIKSLQIGHTLIKETDFMIKYLMEKGSNVEVPFSHRHYFFAIYWIHNGTGKHFIDFKEYEIKPDRVFFIRPEQVHFLHGEKHIEYSALQFTENFMMPFSTTLQKDFAVFNDIKNDEKARISILFKQIYNEFYNCFPNSTSIIQSETNTLLLELERLNIQTHDTYFMPDLLNKYRDLVNTNFKKVHLVQDYATRMGISSNYLNVLTKKHFRKSALSIINDRIILEAKRMLLRSDCYVSEIAYNLGFNELSYFSRFFKRNTGMTPIEFRLSMNEMYQK